MRGQWARELCSRGARRPRMQHSGASGLAETMRATGQSVRATLRCRLLGSQVPDHGLPSEPVDSSEAARQVVFPHRYQISEVLPAMYCKIPYRYNLLMMAQRDFSHDSVSVKHTTYKTTRGRVLVCGDASTGKTAIIKVLSNPGDYPRQYIQTCTADISNKVVKASGTTQVDLLLQDWPGATHHNLRPDFGQKIWESADAHLFVFDIANRDSFVTVAKWHRKALDALVAGGQSKGFKLVGALVGAKSDLRGQRANTVTEAEGKQLALQLGLPYFEVSAEANIGVEAPFAHVAREIAKLNGE